LQARFEDIADGLITTYSATTFTMVTTGLDPNTIVRMTFDGIGSSPTDAEASTKYIQGTIRYSSGTYSLSDITYTGGLGSAEGAGPITGTRNGSEVSFVFTKVEGYADAKERSLVKQWHKPSVVSAWQFNSEYSVGGAVDTTEEHRSSVIYLVLDASTSLNLTQIDQIRNASIAFIDSIYAKTSGIGGTAPNAPSTVSASAGSSSSITVSWGSVSRATGYYVYRSDDAYGTYSYRGFSSGTSYTDTGLSSGATYYYKISAFNSGGESAQSANYASAKTDGPGPEGVYVGLISFADDATDLTGGTPILLDASGRTTLTNYLNANYTIASQSGTALFYAVHKALANLTSNESHYPANLDSVNVITFTDGLDNGSFAASDANPIEGQGSITSDAYLTYVEGQIASRQINGKPITAFSAGVMSGDVSDSTKFNSNLAAIASPGNSATLSDFADLQTQFDTIANGLTEHRSSVIYLVLDASTSLSTFQIGQIRDASIAFIDSIYAQLGP
jgi:fibronectin type 3 domain-containing protein